MWKTNPARLRHSEKHRNNRCRDSSTKGTHDFDEVRRVNGDSCSDFGCCGQRQCCNRVKKADHFADLYNWADAGPLFLIADKQLPSGSPAQIHAHIGYLRATMETRALPELSNQLASILNSQPVASNPALRLWCLGVKGDVDGEMDSASARADWERRTSWRPR